MEAVDTVEALQVATTAMVGVIAIMAGAAEDMGPREEATNLDHVGDMAEDMAVVADIATIHQDTKKEDHPRMVAEAMAGIHMVVDTLSHVAATVVVVIAAGEGATVAEGAGTLMRGTATTAATTDLPGIPTEDRRLMIAMHRAAAAVVAATAADLLAATLPEDRGFACRAPRHALNSSQHGIAGRLHVLLVQITISTAQHRFNNAI